LSVDVLEIWSWEESDVHLNNNLEESWLILLY
jgi:hypothetical protein